MKANYLLIEQFNESGILRYYAAWLHFKRVFVNGCFYESTNIASRVGLSRNTTKKYIKFFLDNGWASYHKGNFRLSGKCSLKLLYGVKLIRDVNLKRHGTLTDILNSLRYSILDIKFKQFKYIQSNYRDLVNPKNITAYKAAKRKSISFSMLQDESKHIALSYISIAKMLNVSKSKAVQLIKQFSEYLVKVPGVMACLGKFHRLGGDSIRHNEFIFKGSLYVVTSNKYEFL